MLKVSKVLLFKLRVNVHALSSLPLAGILHLEEPVTVEALVLHSTQLSKEIPLSNGESVHIR